MPKITISEQKYIRVLTIMALKEFHRNVDFSLSSDMLDKFTELNVLSDIDTLIRHELILLDSEMTTDERLVINPVLYDSAFRPANRAFELVDKLIDSVDTERSNLLISNNPD